MNFTASSYAKVRRDWRATKAAVMNDILLQVLRSESVKLFGRLQDHPIHTR